MSAPARHAVPGESVGLPAAVLISFSGVLLAGWSTQQVVESSPGGASSTGVERGGAPPPTSVNVPALAAELAPPEPEQPAPRPEPADCPPVFEVHFAKGQDAPPEAVEGVTRALVSWMERHPSAHLVFSGHSDASGAVSVNLALSHRRAQNVAEQAIALGLPRARVTARAFGAYQPVVGRAQDDSINRRVTATVQGGPNCEDQTPRSIP